MAKQSLGMGLGVPKGVVLKCIPGITERYAAGSDKLNDVAVRIIRASIPLGLWDSGNAAKVFGVIKSTIMQIASGRNWKHIK